MCFGIVRTSPRSCNRAGRRFLPQVHHAGPQNLLQGSKDLEVTGRTVSHHGREALKSPKITIALCSVRIVESSIASASVSPECLEGFAAGGSPADVRTGSRCFVFPGHGTQKNALRKERNAREGEIL